MLQNKAVAQGGTASAPTVITVSIDEKQGASAVPHMTRVGAVLRFIRRWKRAGLFNQQALTIHRDRA